MGIDFQNVSFKHNPLGKINLKDINLSIESKGEFIFMLGHTGSGKSTLVQNMNALLLPYKGQIEVFDKKVILSYKHPLKLNTKKNRLKYNLNESKHLLAKSNIPNYSRHLREIRNHIGLVFQFPEYQLFEQTVLKDVMFGPKNFGQKEDEARISAINALKLVGLREDYFEKSPFTLSGGEMRRVAIAGILAINPDIIILDEPTVGLDPKSKDNLMNLLEDIRNKTGKTIIVVSHDMNVVAEHATRIIVLDKGCIVYDGDKRRLFEDEDKLHEFKLDLPIISKVAKELHAKELINYHHLPLTKTELETVILGGDIYE